MGVKEVCVCTHSGIHMYMRLSVCMLMCKAQYCMCVLNIFQRSESEVPDYRKFHTCG